MVELRYIGTHQPQGMIADVEIEHVKRLINSGEYEEIIEKSKSKIIKEDFNNDSKRSKKRG